MILFPLSGWDGFRWFAPVLAYILDQRTADVTAKKDFARRRRAATIRRRVSNELFFFSFLLFFKEATIRRTAYVQRTNGSSCTCVEYLTGLSPIHNTCWIALNEEAAARSSSPSKMNRGDRGSIFNHTQPLSLYDHSSDCRSTIWIQRKFAGNSIDFLFSWYY